MQEITAKEAQEMLGCCKSYISQMMKVWHLNVPCCLAKLLHFFLCIFFPGTPHTKIMRRCRAAVESEQIEASGGPGFGSQAYEGPPSKVSRGLSLLYLYRSAFTACSHARLDTAMSAECEGAKLEQQNRFLRGALKKRAEEKGCSIWMTRDKE